MFINLSNHPTSAWSAGQLDAARQYGDDIVDMPFPVVPATASESDIAALVAAYASDIISQYDPLHDVFHVMGGDVFFVCVDLSVATGRICLCRFDIGEDCSRRGIGT